MGDEWLAPPMACGKRPRSPVDKLADLAATAEDDEQDWRSSKRYLTEVIASGFSKLSFKLGMPPHQQQQQQLDPAAAAAGAPLPQLQQQSSISPKTSSWLLPGQLGAQPLVLPDAADCPMDMQESPPTWPPQTQQGQQQQHKPAFAAGPSPPGALAAAGALAGGAWGGSSSAQHDSCAGQAAAVAGPAPPGVFLAGRRTPSPEPCGSLCAAAAAVAGREASPAAPLSPAAAESGGLATEDAGSRAGLPPLQTSKVLRAAEKQPNSPSDLPASSLRKVALLRSLLARAEQQFHQQQGGAAGQQQQQQQQQQGSGVPGHQPQPTRMQQASAPQQQQPEQPELLQQQQQQQQQEACEVQANCSRPPWMQPWGVLPAGDSRSQGEQQLQQQQQQQLPVLPPRPVTPWDVSSDDMDCSSASSAVDSDASSSQQGPQDPAGVLLLQKLAGVDQDQTASALLCREVLFPAAGQESSDCVVQGPPTAAGVLPQQQVQQAQEQRGYGSSRTRQHNMQLPFFNQAPGEPASGPVYGPAQQQQQQGFGTCGSPSHHPPPLPPQQQPGRRSSMHHAPRQGSPELSRQRLEELRARALASTHQLTCLTQEDLHSLQLGLASRRGSVDSSSSHAPSGLQPGVHQQQQQRAAPLPPALRRHSSHI